MTIEHYAAIGEIIASVAVVASLIYVARQLNQTNTMMRVAAVSERLEKDYELVLPMIESREVAEIWVKGANEFAELDSVDQQRMLFFERRAVMLWHHFFHLRTQGLVSDVNWNEQVWILRNIGRRQALRETWKIFRGNFDTRFVEFVDEQFSLADAERRTGA
jgi:hypothetical protein